MFREYMHRIYQALIRGCKRRASRSGHRGRPSGRPAPRFRPWLEGLEDRTVPSAVNWIGGSGDWNDASHWDTGQVPTVTDDALITVAGVTVTHSTGADAVNSLSASGGTFNFSGGTLTVSSTVSGDDAFMLSGGSLANATVASGTTITGTLLGGTLSGGTFNGNLDLTNNANATVSNGLTLNGSTINLGTAAGDMFGRLFFIGTETLDGTGTVLLGGSFTNGLLSSGVANFTIGADILVHGQNGQINFGIQGFANQGTISADTAGGTISLTGVSNSGAIQSSSGSTLILGGTCSNNNIISANGGTVNLNGNFTLAGLGTVDGSSGTVNLTGTLDTGGGTLAFTAATGSWNLVGGTLLGGTVTEADGAELIFTNSGGTLNGVTFNNDLDLTNNASATVSNGLTLNGSTINLGNAAGSTFGQLFFQGTQTLDGTGSVLLGGSSSDGLFSYGLANLTIGADILVHGKNGQINFGLQGFANQGTISADTAGGTISLNGSNWSNTGTIQCSSGTSLYLNGTWSNSGNLSIGNSSTVTVNGSLTQTAGTLTLASGSGLTTTTGIVLQGGTLSGLGTTTGDVLNTGGNVIVGDSGTTVGILTITGNYTQGPGGTLSIKIGGATAGTQYDQLAVGGTATLDGTLNVTLIDGFTPNSGDTFQLLTSTAESGTFASLTGDGTMFTDSYATGGVTLTEN